MPAKSLIQKYLRKGGVQYRMPSPKVNILNFKVNILNLNFLKVNILNLL